MSAGKALNDQNLDLAMKEMDKDGSGEVDFNEFYQWWTSETPKTLQMNFEVLDPAGTIHTYAHTHTYLFICMSPCTYIICIYIILYAVDVCVLPPAPLLVWVANTYIVQYYISSSGNTVVVYN